MLLISLGGGKEGEEGGGIKRTGFHVPYHHSPARPPECTVDHDRIVANVEYHLSSVLLLSSLGEERVLGPPHRVLCPAGRVVYGQEVVRVL